MASGTKSGGVFTGNSTADGKSAGMVTTRVGGAGAKGGAGQKILSAYPQDNVHGVDLPDTRGGSFRGGPTNLAHSLKGSSAVQEGPGAAGGVKYKNGD
jgi:hypothetical protein